LEVRKLIDQVWLRLQKLHHLKQAIDVNSLLILVIRRVVLLALVVVTLQNHIVFKIQNFKYVKKSKSIEKLVII
jgi:hypothetical protein